MKSTDKATQCKMILAYLAEHGKITNRIIFNELGINSPTGRMSDLRRQGYKFDITKAIVYNEDGSVRTHFNIYSLKEETA